jgi:hypothetical protein
VKAVPTVRKISFTFTRFATNIFIWVIVLTVGGLSRMMGELSCPVLRGGRGGDVFSLTRPTVSCTAV